MPALPTRRKVGQSGRIHYASNVRSTIYPNRFPVQQVTIVGVDLMQADGSQARLTWPKSAEWRRAGGIAGPVHRVGAPGFFSPNPWSAWLPYGGVFFGLITSAAVRNGSRHEGFQARPCNWLPVATTYFVIRKMRKRAQDLLAHVWLKRTRQMWS